MVMDNDGNFVQVSHLTLSLSSANLTYTVCMGVCVCVRAGLLYSAVCWQITKVVVQRKWFFQKVTQISYPQFTCEVKRAALRQE